MGTVIGFPGQARAVRPARWRGASAESATVIILPVIRIERYTDDESAERTATRSQRRRRRRRASRSKVSA